MRVLARSDLSGLSHTNISSILEVQLWKPGVNIFASGPTYDSIINAFFPESERCGSERLVPQHGPGGLTKIAGARRGLNVSFVEMGTAALGPNRAYSGRQRGPEAAVGSLAAPVRPRNCEKARGATIRGGNGPSRSLERLRVLDERKHRAG